MSTKLDEVNLLENERVKKGDNWFYSADANESNLKRISDEKEDLTQIVSAGGKAVLVAHQGRYGKAKPLENVAQHLRVQFGDCVFYFPENTTESAADFIRLIPYGSIAVMGNARMNEGEESKDEKVRKELALNYATLVGACGKAAIGGFGKAHRKNASNYDILGFMPGFLTRSQARELSQLENWAGRDDTTTSLAVLGGVKKEKITIGYKGFSQTYDNIIPGGILLNTALKAQGYNIGSSWITEDGNPESENYEKEYAKIAQNSRAKLHLPTEVVIARKTKDKLVDEATIDITRKPVPKDFMIVSYVMPQSAIDALEETVARKGRMVVAGTPDLAAMGFGYATIEVANRLRNPNVRGILLGGDSCCEIDYKGPTSGGGGSALYYISNGTTPVFEKLREQKQRIVK